MKEMIFTRDTPFSYKGYYYWFSFTDSVYYKQKIDSFVKEKISKDEYDKADNDKWYFLK